MTKLTVLVAFVLGVAVFSGGLARAEHVSGGQSAVDELATQQALCPDLLHVEVHAVLLLLPDRSGSVQDGARGLLPKLQTDAATLVQQLPPATLILGRYISARSYSDAESFLADAIPGEPPAVQCVVQNPFDFAQQRHCQLEKRRYQAQLQCIDEARQRIAVTLRGLTPARAPQTDLWGGIAAAADILSVYPTGRRTILLYSDLQDNARVPLPLHLPGLEGVQVLVRAPHTAEPKSWAQCLATLSSRLLHWGATVRPVPLTVPLNPIFVQ